MSIEASLSKLNDIEVTRQGSLRTSTKITEIRASQMSSIKKSQRLTHSRKSMIKNGSSQTFQTDLPLKSFQIVFDECRIYGFQAGFWLTRNSKQRWSSQKYSGSRNSRHFQPQIQKKHHKTFSINHRTQNRQNCTKTEPSSELPFIAISLQSQIKQMNLNKIFLSKSMKIPQASMTINRLMISKFISRRKYENSKIVRRDILPKYLKFSISKCQIHEKIMSGTISSNLFKKHEVYYQRKTMKL